MSDNIDYAKSGKNMNAIDILFSNTSDRLIDVGGVRITGDQVKYALQHFCRRLFVVSRSGENKTDLGSIGSCVLVRLEGTRVIYCAAHQIRKPSETRGEPEYVDNLPDLAVILAQPNAVFLDFARPETISVPVTNDAVSEIAVIAPPWRTELGRPISQEDFFSVDENKVWPRGRIDDALICVGYPSIYKGEFLQNADYVWDIPVNITSTTTFVAAVAVAPYDDSNPAQAIDLSHEGRTEFDGMSGGLVCYVGSDKNGDFLGIAGIIETAGKQNDNQSTPGRMIKMSHILGRRR